MRRSPCACGHDELRVPESRPEAIELYAHVSRLDEQLESVARDTDKWMRVLRCRMCGRYWAEECISSGHADLYYAYPIETGDPVGWLAAAQPLDL
jgi:hypothetical protein